MRALIQPLSVFAIVLLPFIACMDAGGGDEGCADLCIGNACPDPCEDIVCPPDSNPCTREYCSRGLCVSDPVTNGRVCTYSGGDGVCVEGVCGENLCEGVTCDDDDQCTDGTCDYVDGACDFTPAVCDDDNPCTADTCESTRGCIYTEIEDGTACDGSQMCQDGDCVTPCDPSAAEVNQCPILGLEDQLCCPGSPVCTDQYNCGQSVCDPKSAEVYACPIGGLEDLLCCPRNEFCRELCCLTANGCDDGDVCTQDECADNLCTFTPSVDGISCADGAGVCQAGTCVATFPCTDEGIRDAIEAGGGPHTFDCGAPTTVVTQATLAIDTDVILDGEGNLTVDAADSHGIFSIGTGVTAELRNMAMTGGAVPINGGAIWSSGNLTLTNSTVSGSSTERSGGGGVYNWFGTLSLTNSTVSGNSAGGSGRGGGISNWSGTVTLTNSTVSGNSAAYGGGIWSSGVVTLTNSTVSGNTAETYGGGMANTGEGTVTSTNSTVSGNAAESGGGVSNEGGLVALIYCTVSANSAESGSAVANRAHTFFESAVIMTGSLVDGDCATEPGAIATSNGYNIESPGDTCGFGRATDLGNVTEAQLDIGALQDNGGPTDTQALLRESIAVDRIPSIDCVDTDGEQLATDQRGEPRPGGAMCDVGAFELQP